MLALVLLVCTALTLLAPTAAITIDYKAVRGRTSVDRIADFSFSGYASAERDIPVGQSADRTLEPLGRGRDDTARIQAALDRGGVTRLSAGTFVLSADAVVLRKIGTVLQGAGPTKTRLLIGGKARTALRIGEEATGAGNELRSIAIADAYVGVGADRLNVTNATHIQRGSEIFIRRTVSDNWLSMIDMANLTRNGDEQTWLLPGVPIDQMRTVTAVKNRTVHFTPPLVDSVSAAVGDNGTVVVCACFRLL